jgi:hypothetical protein
MVTTVIVLALLGFIAVWIYNRVSGGRIQRRVESVGEGLEKAKKRTDRAAERTQNPQASRTYENEVGGQPQYVLGRIKSFIEPDEYELHEGVKYFGGIDAIDVNQNEIAAYLDPGRYKIAVTIWVILSIVTLGSAIVPWIVWGILRPWLALPRLRIEVWPTRNNDRSRVKVADSHWRDRSEFAIPIEQFIERELV